MTKRLITILTSMFILVGFVGCTGYTSQHHSDWDYQRDHHESYQTYGSHGSHGYYGGFGGYGSGGC